MRAPALFNVGRVVVATVGLVLLGVTASAQVSDTQAPGLTAIDFTPASVDVSSGTASVVVTASATDNLAGVTNVSVIFRSPSGLQAVPASSSQFLSRISGTALNGVYRGTVVFPQFSEAGVWKLSVSLTDAVGNFVNISAASLAALGFPTDVTVTSTPDTVAPQLTGISYASPTLNVSAGAQVQTTTMTMTDDIAGLDFTTPLEFRMTFRSPSGQERYVIRTDFQMTGGTPLNGTFRVNTSFPQYSESGTWTISFLRLIDRAGNTRQLSTAAIKALGINPDFTVVSAPADVTRPTVTSVAFSPSVIDTSAGSQTVTVTITVTDDLSGATFAPDHPGGTSFLRGIQFFSPSGQQNRVNGTLTLAAGTPTNGTWTGTVFFPRFSEAGTWRAQLNNIKDVVHNRFSLTTAQMTTAGFPTQLVIFQPSQETDGFVGPSGGTVNDVAFGPRASLTFPTNALAANTSVAIDVLSTPLAIPLPRGFSAGTLFVNVSFSPTPVMPLPPPGVTLVLPFSSFRVPFSPIHLYRLDAASGLLVPAVNSSGANIIGTVNADGLSATFFGVSRFSTVVGFFPTAVMGDVNEDGTVNCLDLEVVRDSFGRRLGQAGFDARADLNRNGVVDVNDLALVSRQIPVGMTCGS